MKKTVLITGVSSGIGLSTGKLFKKNGWNVIGIDLQNLPDDLEKLELFVQGDVSEPELWEKVATKISAKSIILDAIVNNAGINSSGNLTVNTSLLEWDKIMAVNLRSVYLSVYYLASLLNKKTGAIVNISSIQARATVANMGVYAASKGGILAFTRALAVELAPIRVNAILPGCVDTPLLSWWTEDETEFKNWLKNANPEHLTGAVGKPSEIAEAIYFLADSDRSSFITGEELLVDGGNLAKVRI